ncbi:MAG: thiopurine S-methyltransferase [Gammaproteobacteria bacterium]|nr:thiopurine S-methyltransferase [Gammaproteobacteria bacterium]MBU1725419.1 thiopurine S-methyltransferase [Gammaproteobacteria bacterium]MBU2005289.1 thiopurine S-methyltransferase [Gammaproteobacteria bacterium]
MKAEFWHERWEQNQIGFHQDEFNNHLQAFWDKLSVVAGSRIFVPLCGKSRDMLWLRAQGLLVTGVELSPIAVRDFFSENNLEVVITQQGKLERWESDGLAILVGDFFDMTAADVADCAGVFDRASLIALPPEMRPRYAEHFQTILPSHIQTLLVTLEYAQAEMKGPPFSVSEEEVRGYYENTFAVERLFAASVLDENPGFRQRGLTRLDEKVYKLS